MLDEHDVIDRLKPFLFDHKRGGLFVSRILDGWRIHALTARRKPRDFKPEEIEAIFKAFPKIPSNRLGSIFAANPETSRRAEYLQSRMDTHTSMTSLESRPMPSRGAVSAKEPGDLPRLYAGIDEQSGVLNIFASEYQFQALGGGGERRADELILQFDLDAEDVTRVKAGEVSIDELLRSKSFNGCRVIYYDDNRPIFGKSAFEHNMKSLETIESFFIHMSKTFKLNIDGDMFFHAQDQWLDARSVDFASEEMRGVERSYTPGEDTAGTRRQTFSGSKTLNGTICNGEIDAADGTGRLRPATSVGANGKVRTSETVFSFLDGMTGAQKARITATLDELGERLTKALRRVG